VSSHLVYRRKWGILANYLRQFFTPATKDENPQEDKVDDVVEKTSDEIPILPDVPTNEPAEDGQPDAKKRKVSSEDTTEGK